MMRVIISVVTPTGRLGELNQGPVPTASGQTRLQTWWGGGQVPQHECPFGAGERGMLHFSAGQ